MDVQLPHFTPMIVWTLDLSGHGNKEIKLPQKCLGSWNAAIGVDEGKNATSANQHLK